MWYIQRWLRYLPIESKGFLHQITYLKGEQDEPVAGNRTVGSSYLRPQSIAGKAINYTLKRWTELTQFLKHPVIELSTNWAENSMRTIAIGRRNWLHVGSMEAGPKIAALFSIVESCSKLGIPIRQYLADGC
ncbi:MAG: transposase [Terracidiphilus sp.]|nr:transposase [Terracidiphilus sp.]